jgi:hypothetical protein
MKFFAFAALTFAALVGSSALADPINQRSLSGTWTAHSYNNGYQGEAGTITFYPNGTFQVTGGFLGVLITDCGQDCTGRMGTWQVIHGNVLKMKLDGIDANTNRPFDFAFPFQVDVQRNQIELVRAANLTVLTRP